jgi:hypothetical protein
MQKGCYTYLLLTQARPHKKHTKSNNVSETQQGSLSHQSLWCILRVHCHKWVLHSLPVDAGMATPETHQNTPTGQKCSKANLHMKEWCILIQQVSRIQRNVCPFPSLLQRIIAGTQCRAYMLLRKVHIPKPSPVHNCRYTMQKP